MRVLVLLAAAAAALPAAAQDYPRLKAGQWDVTTVTSSARPGTPPIKTSMCTDDALQKEMLDKGNGMSREMCSKNDVRREGNKILGYAECRIGDSKFVSRSVMTFTGDTAYHTEITATYDPPFMGQKDSRITLDGRYAGPCREGLVPGDFIAPNGQKFNVRAAPPAGGPAPSAQPKSPAKAPQ